MRGRSGAGRGPDAAEPGDVPWRPRGVRRVLVASLVTVILVGGGALAAARWPADAPRAAPPPAMPAGDCPSGYVSTQSAPPDGSGAGAGPVGDRTPSAAIARLEAALRRHLAGVNGGGFQVTGRQVTTGADRATVTLVGGGARPLARGEVVRAPDGTWTRGGTWACSPY
jgi:hypothetical protein